MLINGKTRAGLHAFQGAWEDWCATKFANDPDALAKCNKGGIFAPWTDVGALERGLPKPSSLLVSIVQGGPPGPATTGTPAKSGAFGGVPTTIMLAGGAVLAGGIFLLMRKRKGRR